MREMVGGCCVCSDDRGWSENPLVYCDGQSCTVAVHQACYGIVTVPTGPWYCRKCESQERSVKVKCELCPSKYGALKKTDNSGWAHVVCALYIPEVRFGNVTTMEPIQLQLIPAERFNKVCYICEEKGKPANANVGACMQCNKAGCKQQFHVTCAQGLGLLCEEAGNYLDNVKYCGYCQHHYSKLKKGGNVKTIPPYKPVGSEAQLSDSNSEKEAEAAAAAAAAAKSASPSSNKRKSSTSGKSAIATKTTTPTSSKISSSSSSQQKTVHPSKGSEKSTSKVSSSTTNSKTISESSDSKKDLKEDSSEPVKTDSKVSKKRKANSRTPTPVSGVPATSDVAPAPPLPPFSTAATPLPTATSDKKNHTQSETEKTKKLKIDTTQSIIIKQPVVALTSISAIKTTSLVASTVADTASSTTDTVVSALPSQSIIQTQSPPVIPPVTPPVNSLVVSVPLASTTIINNQTSVLTSVQSQQQETDKNPPAVPVPVMTAGGNSNPPPPPPPATGSNMLTTELSQSGGLKIMFEKQPDVINTEVDMELEVSPTPPVEEQQQQLPAKRAGLTQSNEKTERASRKGKRSGNQTATQITNGPASSSSSGTTKRSSRSQVSSPSPAAAVPGAFASITQAQMALKHSPPTSNDENSQDATSSSSRMRSRGRKSAPAAVNAMGGGSSSSKDIKDIKIFQNGVAAPHMLGNQLNPNSNMAQKMSDHLNSELEAHSIFNPNDNSSNLVGPQMHHRVVQNTRASSTGGSSTASGGSGLSSMLGGGGGNIPQTLDQLLERQWEQGSQFLMEQAQHFDIASLLSCLHQLRAENLRLEEHVSSLLQRRDHLLAVNARLAIPLTGQPNPSHPHSVNNIHPNVGGGHAGHGGHSGHSDGSRQSQRHSTGNINYSSGGPVENGLPPSTDQYGHPHRSPAPSQPSPTVRHSPAGTGYSNSGGNSGRSAPRPQTYPAPQYQGIPSGPPPHQQILILRDCDMRHQNPSKPS